MKKPENNQTHFTRISNGATEDSSFPVFVCIENDIETEEFGMVHTYGIKVEFNDGREAQIYPDLSPDGEKIHRLVDLMNTLQIAPIHVDDVNADFMVDYSI